MNKWSPQSYLKTGLEQGLDRQTIEHAISVANEIVSIDSRLPPIFSLNHLAYLTDTDHSFLRMVVSRSLDDPYHTFQLRKGIEFEKVEKFSRDLGVKIPHERVSRNHGRGFRTICVPSPKLMQTQKWISKNILMMIKPHEASVAYANGSKIVDAAKLHCGCQWMIKLDVRNFFESISEQSAYYVFKEAGYQPLVAFEMARICTRVSGRKKNRSWRSNSWQYDKIDIYKAAQLGHLPQGAPTSPMLSNLAMRKFDSQLMIIATNHRLYYTRYADDVCLSTDRKDFSRGEAAKVISDIYTIMNQFGLSPNLAKTRVVSPGARKMVLGLLVDRDKPRLSREFRARIRQHIHYITHPGYGPVEHSLNRGFSSVWGLRNHVEGLIAHACQVDPEYGDECKNKLKDVKWPF